MKRTMTISRKKNCYQINDDHHNEWHFITATEAFRRTASFLNDELMKQIYLVENIDDEFEVELTIKPKA